MTTNDPERLAACLDVLRAARARTRTASTTGPALWSLAEPHRRDSRGARARRRREGGRAEGAGAVEALAETHAKALGVEPGREPSTEALDGPPARLPARLPGRARRCDELAARWKDALDAHEKDGRRAPAQVLRSAQEEGPRRRVRGRASPRSQKGFLWCECWDEDFRDNLKAWQKDAKKLKLSKKALKDYDAVMPAFDEQIAAGWKAFAALNAD